MKISVEPQTARGRSNCKCAASCAYCFTDLDGVKHDHDHFPRPWRHGGRTVTATCKRCHSKKDRHEFRSWTDVERYSIIEGIRNGDTATIEALQGDVVVAHFLEVFRGAPLNPEWADGSKDTDLIALIGALATPAARIALARIVCLALDAEHERTRA